MGNTRSLQHVFDHRLCTWLRPSCRYIGHRHRLSGRRSDIGSMGFQRRWGHLPAELHEQWPEVGSEDDARTRMANFDDKGDGVIDVEEMRGIMNNIEDHLHGNFA